MLRAMNDIDYTQPPPRHRGPIRRFFGGLWWTVRKSLVSSQPAVWVFCSLLLRMGVTMTGFYFVSGADWQRLLA